MLQRVRVRHFALIDDLTLEFGSGFNLLSGETGAGKSLIVDALGLLAGAKASSDVIRAGKPKAVLEAIFEHPKDLDVDSLGIDPEDDLIIRREIASDNRNRVFINNQSSTVATLRLLTASLVDIHGQHEHQSLLEPTEQLALVDRAATAEVARKRVGQLYNEIRTLARELETLEAEESASVERRDLLEFQRDEIDKVQPLPDEASRLRRDVQVLENRGRLLEAAGQGYESLYESDASILSALSGIEGAIRDASVHDPRLQTVLDQLSDARANVEDVAYALRDYVRGLDLDPVELEHLQVRLAELERLHRKYGENLLEHVKKVNEELDSLGLRGSRKSMVAEELARLRSEYDEVAQELSRKRHAAAKQVSRAVTEEIRSLAMPEAAFSMEWASVPEGRQTGLDSVRFLLAPNRGEPSGPLATVASGGELSRTMLALRTHLAVEGANRTLVFDEIDAGIGGEAAVEVGRKLKALSKTYQVLCVTHLPQIARFADHHYRIDKVVDGSRTSTRIEVLDAEARVEELARMISGAKVTDAARRHVRELLRKG